MRIIGGHDYYDGAGMGIDKGILFLREETAVETDIFQLPGAIETAHYYSRAAIPFKSLDFGYVILAGEFHPAMIFHEKPRLQMRRDFHGNLVFPKDITRWIYNRDEAESALDDLNAVDARFNERHFARRRQKIAAHFEKTAQRSWTDFVINQRIVTGVVRRDPQKQKQRDAALVRCNVSDLKDIDFYRQVDAPTAHMRIASFISGVLADTREVEELSDLARIRKAGFDTITSFRQDPGVKKPRRRQRA